MLTRLLNDPPLLAAFGIVMFAVLMVLWVAWEIRREARSAGLTTAEELRKDAHTAERRAKLQVLQRRERRGEESA